MGDKSVIETKIKDAIGEILHAEDLEEAFCGFVVHSAESEDNKKQLAKEILKELWSSLPKEGQDLALRLYVIQAFSQSNASRMRLLFSTVETMVENSLISPKHVCDAVLSSDKLSIKYPDRWISAFSLIRRVIGGVDYKGCRDLLKVILEKAYTIPFLDNVATLCLVDNVCDVVNHILSRESCLLPGYFAVYEITKLCSDKAPHWKMGDILTKYVQSFRPAAQLVTITGRQKLLPVVGHSIVTTQVWKLSHTNLQFELSGPLPYDKELSQPQTELLRHVLEQPYSRDMVCNMLGLNKNNKTRCPVLEQQLVEMIVLAMEHSENEEEGADSNTSLFLWQHLSTQIIFFVLFQFASFPDIIMTLYDKLKGRNLKKGRDHLMWVLLQFISGSIQRNKLKEFLPVLRLFDLLYSEKDVLPAPDVTKANAAHQMAVTCIWIHLTKKAQIQPDPAKGQAPTPQEYIKLQRPIPYILKGHVDYLKHCLTNHGQLNLADYRVALLCNAYSTNQEYFNPVSNLLLDYLSGSAKQPGTTMLPGGISAAAPTQPLSVNFLDSLTVHSKMRLIHSVIGRMMKPKSSPSIALAPAMIETYSRLLIYIEIESLGIKGFISQLLPTVIKGASWYLLHTLLEILSYRLHHIQPSYCVQLLGQLHSLAAMSITDQNQLHLRIESTALRLILGLGSAEVQPQFTRFFTEQKQPGAFLSQDSEELNRVLVLTLARAMHVTGSESYSSSWLQNILGKIMAQTPHNWSSHTLMCFPQPLQDFFNAHPHPREEKNDLKVKVDIAYRKWKSMVSESDLVNHFSLPGNPPLFLCVLWKSLLEDGRVSPTAYKVLDKIGPTKLTSHLRIFADYLVYEFSVSADGQHVNKCVEALNGLIWKCNVFTIDRLVLCLVLRSLEGSEAQVCFFIIHLLLIKPQDFRNRVTEFVAENSPDHWLQSDWHKKHMAFHTKFPEKLYYEGVDMTSAGSKPYLPIYFDNVCLRFLPVFDIVIHRFIELPSIYNSLYLLLDAFGGLYKFHSRPLTYLYNTLYYYEKKLKEKCGVKKKLVGIIVGSLKEVHPKEWCLSTDFLEYCEQPSDDMLWVPNNDYYTKLVSRLVETINGKVPAAFASMDWRFNEFPNAAAHALYSTCIELMALPASPQNVGGALLDVVLKGYSQIPRDQIISWMNAIGLIITALPESYWSVINDRLVEALGDLPVGLESKLFETLNFTECHQVLGEVSFTYILALTHAIWQHASLGQLSGISQLLREKFKPHIKTEEQFLFLCRLVGPFLQRFHLERTRCLLEVTIELYNILRNVDRECEHLHYMDTISDFLYHIKYIFVGDAVKAEVEKVICCLRPALQMRLRFISHHVKEEAAPAQPSAQAQAS